MSKRVLVVEDEEIIASMVQDNLEARGYEVLVANSGIEGLRKAEIYEPDLIALDIMMPGLDGIDVLRRLKANKETRDIPVIILSIAEGYQKEGLKLGAAAFIKKPFDFNTLTDKIKSFTENKSVLVVEDNKETLKLIEIRMRMLGYEVRSASDEAELFSRLEEGKPDIILMDVVLPGQDGLAIIRKLKAMKEYSEIPVIVFSGYVSDELSEKEIAGVEKYIDGDINPQALVEEVRTYIDKISSETSGISAL